ncbi:ArsR/SmtB family transcription factor [Methylobacter tundripaludum]|uniref:Regulatory protein ArsR n=1 Tax=Methylobacter tundripaludum (strain ATCC BAA-1195 / DSM 17260 / SV96) TaxID=697282 RepID=G3J259_METTV|nr:helix-turn-helix transcriptional regulator [Methylobacter tundripaludum]EGW19815.1 regulatory protein ArsR [Methylobacter tundripaludum SV96]
MDKQLATTIFESLASGIRLDVFRLLVKHAPTGLVAGEIATLLVLPPTNLSFHLKAMTHAGLVSVTQEGRYQRYRANLTVMQALIDYLTAECCTGSPEHCFDADKATSCRDTN